MADQVDWYDAILALGQHAFARPSPPQAAHLERVSNRIGPAILDFCRARVGQQFHAGELREHVERACGQTAPGSADRILRALRKQGAVAYRVLSRKDSLYLVEGA